jgi:hypothetical protein
MLAYNLSNSPKMFNTQKKIVIAKTLIYLCLLIFGITLSTKGQADDDFMQKWLKSLPTPSVPECGGNDAETLLNSAFENFALSKEINLQLLDTKDAVEIAYDSKKK